MSREELIFRIREKLKEAKEYALHSLGKDKISEERWYRLCGLKSVKESEKALLKRFIHGKRDLFFTESYDKETRKALMQKNLDFDKMIAEAEKILQGSVTLLGYSCRIPDQNSWQHDPRTDDSWPSKFYLFAKKKKQKNDIKYVWEINRLQYLITLGKAFWLTNDEKYAKRVFSIIQDWIRHNPYNLGINWTSSLELAVRSISWIWAYFLCRDSKCHTEKVHNHFTKSLYEHGRHIEDHLSYYSSPYNHLIGEAAALHLIGSLFPLGENAKKWEDLGWKILSDQVKYQFYDDGMCVEQASFYHHFTLGFYLQSILLRKMNNKEVSDSVLNKIENALEISMHLTKPDGTLPMIGDVDNARSLFFNGRHSWNFRGFLALGAVLFNRPDFKYQSRGHIEELLWLGSEPDIVNYENIRMTEPSETSIAFFESGYFISRDSWDVDSNYLCFDCGQIAAGLSERSRPSAAHGHADALSFELAVKGKSFIGDSGFYTYFGDIEWHKFFRQEEAHNTLIIGKLRQAQYCGRLTWQYVRRPKLYQWESLGDYDVVTGSILYKNGMSHIRQLITIKSHFWLIKDYVATSNKKTTIQSFLNFNREVHLKLHEETCELVANIGKIGLLIKFPSNTDVKVEKGGEQTAGWMAYGYGIKFPASHAKFSWISSNFKVSFVMLLIPFNLGLDVVTFETNIEGMTVKSASNIKFSVNDIRYSVNTKNSNYTQISIDEKEFKVASPEVRT